jgi:uncharacterized protein YlxP (DUF503 family)
MALTKTTYINTELNWAEEQLHSWRAYIDNHPLDEMTDRIEWKPTAKGGAIPMVIASVEAQGKFVQETMKNYLALLEVVERLRTLEEAKKQARGSSSVPHRMQD